MSPLLFVRPPPPIIYCPPKADCGTRAVTTSNSKPEQPHTNHERNTDLKSTQSSILQQLRAAQLDISKRKNTGENARFSLRRPPLKRSQRHFSTLHGCIRHHTERYSRPMNDMGCGVPTVASRHALFGRLGHIPAVPGRTASLSEIPT